MRADDRALVDLAASVADGSPSIGTRLKVVAPGRERRIVRHLRLVESIAALHRSIPPTEHRYTTQTPADARRQAVGTPRPARGHRQGHVVRRSSRVGHRAPPQRRAEAAPERSRTTSTGERVMADANTRGSWRRPGGSRACATSTSSRSTAPRNTTAASASGPSSCAASRSRDRPARGPLGAREAALVGLDVCAALAAVHGAGLLHRDVKAQNVMREAGGRIVLMDFGTGEDLSSGTSRLVGTPLYLAPEIFARPEGVGPERHLQPRRHALLSS